MLCKNDDFWEQACKMRRMEKHKKQTEETTWREHFVHWCRLQHTNDTLRKAVLEILKIDSSGATPHDVYGHISSWDVSQVTNMYCMFFHAKKFDQPLNTWDVSNVTNMSHMFSGASKFNQPLNTWDVSKVENMQSMFEDSKNFNQPLDDWNVSNVTNMFEMFHGAEMFNQSLNKWNVSKVTVMGLMFFGASNFNQPLDNWNVSNVENMDQMFSRSGFQQENTLQRWSTKLKDPKIIKKISL